MLETKQLMSPQCDENPHVTRAMSFNKGCRCVRCSARGVCGRGDGHQPYEEGTGQQLDEHDRNWSRAPQSGYVSIGLKQGSDTLSSCGFCVLRYRHGFMWRPVKPSFGRVNLYFGWVFICLDGLHPFNGFT